jgi:hypothetical protein
VKKFKSSRVEVLKGSGKILLIVPSLNSLTLSPFNPSTFYLNSLTLSPFNPSTFYLNSLTLSPFNPSTFYLNSSTLKLFNTSTRDFKY